MELDVQKQVEKWTLESALVVPALTDGHSRADLPRLGDKRWASVGVWRSRRQALYFRRQLKLGHELAIVYAKETQ